MAENMVEKNVLKCIGDVSILLIDHDTASVTALTTMLDRFSNKVMTVDVASKALSIIEEHNDIGLIIVNTEMLDMDLHSFVNDLLHKDIPLILICPETNTNEETTELLSKGACFVLKNPFSENGIKNMLQQVMVPKENQVLKKINIAEKHDHNVLEESVNQQMVAFRETLKRQRASQSSLLGTRRRRPFITTFDTYQKRRNIASSDDDDDQCKNHSVSRMESFAGRRFQIWTYDRHMKFLAAISILGEQDSRPKSILRIMNDPNLNQRQVGSHLQKYKAKVDRISDKLSKKECKSTDKTFEYPSDYVYPFKTSNLKSNLIKSNSLWYSLENKKSSSSSTVQYSFKKAAKERESSDGNVLNKSSMSPNHVPLATSNIPTYSISSKSDGVNHNGMVSTGLSSDKPHGASNLDAFEIESASHVLGSNIDPIDLENPSAIPNSYSPQVDLCIMGESSNSLVGNNTMNPLETNMDQMGLVPSLENFGHQETNMNPMEWVHSTDSYALPEIDMNMIVHETNINQVDCVSSGASNVLFGDMIFQEADANDDFGFVSGETNTNHMDWFFSEESYAFLEKMVASDETNTAQVGLVSCETSYAALDNLVPLETSMDGMGLVPFKTSYAALENVVPLETGMEEMGLVACEADYAAFDNVLPLETNLEEMGLVSCETSFAPLDNMVPLEAGMDEMGFVSCEGSNEIAIEDLICFDTDFNEMDLDMESITEEIDVNDDLA